LNLYLDTSAFIKRYTSEAGATALRIHAAQADLLATAQVTYVEMASAFARAARIGSLSRNQAARGLASFQSDWPLLQRVGLTEGVVNRAALLAWDLGLRGYDAVHLAAALIWQSGLSEAITFATYDQQLWRAAQQSGVVIFPQELSKLVSN
jgi:predicted nucleic acid-binding protein